MAKIGTSKARHQHIWKACVFAMAQYCGERHTQGLQLRRQQQSLLKNASLFGKANTHSGLARSRSYLIDEERGACCEPARCGCRQPKARSAIAQVTFSEGSSLDNLRSAICSGLATRRG
nr:hypothetical protein [Devosia naphthalenivorans]